MPVSEQTAAYESEIYTIKNNYFTDATFFDIFDVPFKYGTRDSALSKPNCVVISDKLKIFGSSTGWENAEIRTKFLQNYRRCSYFKIANSF
ncbi:MAG: hypothetical protein R2850_00815 [Bacteroidia bacterium]